MYFFKQLPVQLIISIILAFILGRHLDVSIISFFYSISSCFIEILLFALPVMVFGFIFRALINSSSRSLSLLFMIFGGVTLSNCLALAVAYACSRTFLPFFGLAYSPEFIGKFVSDVSLLFSLGLPKIIGTEKALALGLVVGTVISYLKDDSLFKKKAQVLSDLFSNGIIIFLQKIFMPLLPLYVFGFCLKLSYDDALFHLFQQFGKIFILSLGLVAIYISMLYLIGAGGHFKKAIFNLKSMVPAGLTGFSTMSSAATLPVTLICVEKTTRDRRFTDLIVPSTANIHMLGDDLTIVVTSMALLSIFGMPEPDFISFVPFMVAFAMAKLSCVGVPGASVLVILPVLQNHLGFDSEMISVLTTLYILQDSFGTAANVMGNGAFALIIQRLYAKLFHSVGKSYIG